MSQFNIDQTVGGTHRLSVNADGTRIAVVEDIANVFSLFDDHLTPIFPPIHLKPIGVAKDDAPPSAFAAAITSAGEYVTEAGGNGSVRKLDPSGKEVPGSPGVELGGLANACERQPPAPGHAPRPRSCR